MRISDSWILMWGIAYLACAIVAPDIFLDLPVLISRLTLITVGTIMICGLIFANNRDIFGQPVSQSIAKVGRVILFVMGVEETFGGILSFSGQIMWNVPFADKALFNVSMAFAELVTAMFLFNKALGKWGES